MRVYNTSESSDPAVGPEAAPWSCGDASAPATGVKVRRSQSQVNVSCM